MGKRLTLFELLGFKINVDVSWLFLAIFVTWSLSATYFPFRFEGLQPATYWTMGVVGSAGLFFSIIFHELSHSIVARRYDIPITGITLFIFGGVAEMEREPPSAKSEFFMAIAGPLASVTLAFVFYQLSLLGPRVGASVAFIGVAQYLALINALLAIFNMIPAFPLDGGRAFRAALWYWTNDMRRATRRAAAVGSAFGLMLIAAGVTTIIMGGFVTGLWWALIGLFLRSAANASNFDVNLRQAFEGEPVSRFMTAEVIAVPPSITVGELVENYIYRFHYDLFPVTEDERLLGCVSTQQVREVSREQWGRVTVGEILVPRSAENCIDMNADALSALTIMRRTGSGRLLVTDGERLVGIIVLKDMLALLALKLDLEGPANSS